MNASDPLVRDRGIVTNRDKETSLQLHRKNSMQRDQLDRELRRLDREQQQCIRRTHLEKCALSRDRKCLACDFAKLTVSAAAAGDDDAPSHDEGAADQTGEPPKSPPATRRREAAPPPPKQRARARRVSLPDAALPEQPGVSVATTKRDKQERFVDQRASREIGRLKKASVRADPESKESEDRQGKPRIPPNAWCHANQNPKARERSSSVFDRLTEGNNIKSMPSQQFLQRVRKQRSHTIPASSPSGTRRSERR